MKNIKVLFTILLGLFSNISFTQVLTDEEIKLYELIMEYRNENELPNIPLSASLTYVAHMHVKDLVFNKPDIEDCNGHSWSSKGDWTPCCYTSDHARARCMWLKPSELTSYKGYGYEIAAMYNDGVASSYGDSNISAEVALKSWKGSAGHNAVILNQSSWKDMHWKAIGIGIFKGYAVVWFGEESDL